MIRAFTLALCRLPLWLLVSIEISKLDQYYEYLSSVSLRLQKVYSNTWMLCFKRQMDLQLMFPSIISLCTVNQEKWTKLFKNLLALVLAYSVLIFTAITFIPLRIFSVLREYYFAYFLLLHHRACITSLTLLQSHHHKSLIKLTSLQLHHHTSLIKLMSITSLHFNYNTCSKLTLHYSCIPPHSPDIIHLQIRSGFQLPHLSSTLVSLFHKFVSSSTSNNIWNTSKLLLLSGDVETNPEP